MDPISPVPTLAQAAVGGVAAAPLFIIVVLAVLAIPVGIVALLYLIVPFFKGIGFCIRQVARFIGGEIGDALRIVGAVITTVVLLPLTLLNVLIGRWSAAAHFGRAISGECTALGLCAYRMVVGHPARLLCLTALTDGIERRIPAAVAASPGADAPNPKRAGQFEGYTIVGSLPGGGSGGKLYVAEPDAIRRASFERAGQRDVRQVVIKTFSLRDGSSLPQIVRESRSLDAAKRLGLVLDHELTAERFFYVMRYVPGESLGLVTQRLHAACDSSGLDDPSLAKAMEYGSELLRTLQVYHSGGLWHKDVKPDNIIVDGRAAHLVDFGLVTPLRSAMTLTTHGTEYFRDPEMVRQALKGVKVDQVDGARFDLYAAGAVLFSIIENSFPAHGGLSQITRRCPEALRWVVRRAMTDYDKRYTSAGVMLADIDYIRRASDPFAVKPFELPSMRDVAEAAVAPVVDVPDDAPLRRAPEPVAVGAGSDQFNPGFGAPAAAAPAFAVSMAGSPMPRAAAAAASIGAIPRRRPKLRVNRWWTGGYVSEDDGGSGGVPLNGNGAGFTPEFFAGAGPLPGHEGNRAVREAGWVRRPAERTAREQVENARQRAAAARERAKARVSQRRGRTPGDFHTVNVGVGFAVLVLLAAIGALFFGVLTGKNRLVRIVSSRGDSSTPAVAYASGELPEAGEIGAVSHAPQVATPTKRSHRSSSRATGQPRLVVNGQSVGAITGAQAASVSGETALVISDIQPATPAIESAVTRLKTAGFNLWGNYPGNTAGPGEIEHQLALEAQARQVRDVGSLDEDRVSERLAGWLADHRDLGMLVWFAKGGEEGATHFYVVTPSMAGGTGRTPRDATFSVGMEALAGRPN